MSQLDDSIKKLQDDVTAEKTVEESAIKLLNGIPQMIKDAVQAAQIAGATPGQLAALSDLATTLEKNSTDLSAAVTANTPTPTSASAPPPESDPNAGGGVGGATT